MTKFGDVLTTDDIPTGGTTILNGTGPPADALGAVGNYYLDTVAKILYGPKLASPYGPDQVTMTAIPPAATTNNGENKGLKFKPLVASRITALRYYRTTPIAADHVVTLILSSDSPQAELGRTLVNVTTGAAAGWQSVPLSSPVVLTANADYRVWYYYSLTSAPVGYQNPLVPTSAIPSVVTLNGNCVSNPPTGTFPSTSTNICYFADVVLQVAIPLWPVALKSAP